MAKTTFSSGVIVTSEWLNGAKRLSFDGQDRDWHYPPLGLESLVSSGPNGLDSRYVTLSSSQPNLTLTGLLVNGAPISGDKVVTGKWWFGLPFVDDGSGNNANPSNTVGNAPRSYTTNSKYEYAGGTPTPSITQKYASLNSADLVTVQVLSDQLSVIDDGIYA